MSAKTDIFIKDRADPFVTKGSDGYYYTKVDDMSDKGKRKLLKKSKLDALEDAIVKHYKTTSYDPTVQDVFYEWINEKLKYGEMRLILSVSL